MHKFLKEEFARLVETLPKTDPRTQDYHILLRSIEALDAIGQTIEGVFALDDQNSADQGAPVIQFPGKPTDSEPVEDADTGAIKPEPVEPEPEPTPLPDPVDPPKEIEQIIYTAAQVRKALVDSRNNKGVNVREVLQQFGVDNFQALPESKYSALMAALEVV